MGRPTKLTSTVHDRIIQAISVGATYDLAAAHGGITSATLRNWRDRGETALELVEIPAEEQAYADLAQAVLQAEGTAAVAWLAKIEKAASDPLCKRIPEPDAHS